MIQSLRVFARFWQRRPLQLLLVVLGLAIATALWSAVQAINTEARTAYAEAVETLGGADLVTLSRQDPPLTRTDYVALRRAGWQVTPVLEEGLALPSGRVTLMGVDLLSHPSMATTQGETSAGSAETLALLTGAPKVFASPALTPDLEAAGFEVWPNDRLPPNVVLADISLVASRLGDETHLTRLLVLPNQPMGLPPLEDVLPGLRIARQSEGSLGDAARLTDSFHLNLTAFGLLAFAVGLFIVQGTMTLSLEHRRGTIFTLRTLGVSVQALMGALVLELFSLALLGGLLGVGLGYFLAAALLPDVSGTLSGLYGAAVGETLALRADWVLSGLGMALLGSVLAGAQAFWLLQQTRHRLSNTPRGPRRPSTRRVAMQAGLGLCLITAGTLVLLAAQGLLAAFTFLGGQMIGAALLLPLICHLLLRLTRPAALRWLVADSLLQLPGLSLALMALLLALATNIGVSTMVSSFRLTFEGWIDQRLAADLYLRIEGPAEAERIADWARQHDLRPLPQWRWQSRSATAPLQIYGVEDDPLYRRHWPLVAAAPEAWDRVFDQQGVLINEQLSLREDLSPGDTLALAPEWQLEVVGVYSDYGNPEGQAIVSAQALHHQGVPLSVTRVGLARKPMAPETEVVKQALTDDLNLPSEDILVRQDIRDTSLAIFDRTFVVTAALNVLTLGVAGFALFTSFLSQWSRRLAQLAPMAAMGMTRRRLAIWELLRSLGFALITYLCALPLGVLLAYVLLTVINKEAFGWRLPMWIFPLDWLWLGLWVALMAILAAVIPALRLMRLPPARLLGAFAHDA